MSILSDIFLSHPDKPYINHIQNMIEENEDEIAKEVKKYHDIAKLKGNFQIYIRDTTKNISNKDHSFLSAYIFLLNSSFDDKTTIFGFLSILSHHGNVKNLRDFLNVEFKENFINLNEFKFWDEVIINAKKLPIYKNIKEDKSLLNTKVKELYKFLLGKRFHKNFSYEDFVDFKKIYSNLIYSDKYEAIFNQKKEILNKINIEILEKHIQNLPANKKRADFRNYVLSNFDKNHKLFTLTAPTGYGKTLTALNYALKFQKERIIFALPFTSIIDQTYEIISKIYKNSEISVSKVHHKTLIDESVLEDRYSKIKFLINSFSSEINITTLYQIIFTIFGNKNKDNVKFNQLKNSVIIIDEAQAIPYVFRKDFLKLCEIISQKLDSVFIFMSATMPIIKSENFREISNLKYFKEQNRYTLKWLDFNESKLKECIKKAAKTKHTLVVVNTIKKAQELYEEFKNDFECYCLNANMYDIHKQEVIGILKEKLIQNDKKILLISTQSIEAGVDLSFEIGFREISPISSIIQTAGRINRHFGDEKGILYIFGDISGYSDLIYGDLQTISKNISEILKQKDVDECDILDLSKEYFTKIHNQLETYYCSKNMNELAFATIYENIRSIMEKNHKEFLLIEPRSGFVEEIQMQLLSISKKDADKFLIKDLRQNIIKKLLQYGVSISEKDKRKQNKSINLKQVKYIKNIDYLPFGALEYSMEFGLKKIQDISITQETFS